ncbi:protein-glutamate methylesterase/protein-glutamine glutaminase [Kurthia sibirica]|uniref:Protein-glutamate methylesterase/protein-glutamine glutaminase n=1 Tax=Kurthia sibirica TaxID=202750 RepID=A0A2U3AR36_9BACL|nr:chemotaxis response regulator protein-glutamate methylesterase [Kurthia sibirica]PWI26915.1 chemotaxis response regulator protein-glutamate methylesterase [Kurthia sibirica]GEK32543.1 chemotaxis response regulator protein-glutamate methylesterase [Kurthia sibirica]
MASPKKLLIVDDSAFMRKLISDFFKEDDEITVVGTARNGKDAIDKIAKLNPDVLTMDVEMPEMNGVEALKIIMEKTPKPVIMLSSMTTAGASITIEAISLGAVDFVAKPSGTISLDLHKIQDELVRKVKAAIDVPITSLKRVAPTAVVIPHVEQPPFKTAKVLKARSWNSSSKKIVLIGTSTGGPRALQDVLTAIPASIPAPILIVQHMPAGFTKSLANRLNTLSEITVKEAEMGDILQNGVAYIAPGGKHMTVRKIGMTYSLYLDEALEQVGGHKPSVDVLFRSVAPFSELSRVAVIMTGMGSDGTKGLQALKRVGNTIAIAEAQASCVVYGMPKSAVQTNLVDEEITLNSIAQTIMKYVQ